MTEYTWPDLLTSLVTRQNLDAEATGWAMNQVLTAQATPIQVAALGVALRTKGETVEEVEGLVAALLDSAEEIEVPGRTLDIVGTGGDRSFSVNISTMSAIVAAGAGAKVVKHGNRAATSRSGTADVLEHLGVRLDLTPAQVAQVASQVGIAFCFAPIFHPALKHAAAPRKALGVQTTFNFLGPLANPARPTAQAIGCADPTMLPIMSGVFARRGVDALVFRGDDGLDELTTTTTSTVHLVTGGEVRAQSLDPADLGLPPAGPEDLRGGEVDVNAAVVRDVVAGKKGPVRDAVLLNAGAALAVYEGLDLATPLTEQVTAGMARAEAALDAGEAQRVLRSWIDATGAF